MSLSDLMQHQFKSQMLATQQCQNYFYKDGEEKGFDSTMGMPEIRPDALNDLLTIMGFDSAADVDEAIKQGIGQYQYCHGGDLPHPSVIASALFNGVAIAKKVHGYSASISQGYSDLEKGFDDVSNTHQESVSIVPALSVTTIATTIAYASPIVAYIPNSNGSNEVPIVAARFVTDRAFGAMNKNDYLDGVQAAKPYAEGRFRFALSNNGAGDRKSVV